MAPVSAIRIFYALPLRHPQLHIFYFLNQEILGNSPLPRNLHLMMQDARNLNATGFVLMVFHVLPEPFLLRTRCIYRMQIEFCVVGDLHLACMRLA